MAHHTNDDMSENEQMYLVAIAQIQEETGQDIVSLSALANALAVLPVSANQMIRKLDENGLVEYTPYKGVAFTPAGEQLVLQILRYRRLWEIFLVNHLRMSLEEADAQACRMEHITSEDVANRLDLFLGEPAVCLHGHPIPKPGALVQAQMAFPLTKLQVQDRAIIQVLPENPTTRTFLINEGLTPGAVVFLFGIGAQGDVLVSIGNNQVYLSHSIASQVNVLAETRNLLARSSFKTDRPGDTSPQ